MASCASRFLRALPIVRERPPRFAAHLIRPRVVTSVYSRAVRKAAELAGGREKLSRMLQVPVAEIEKWLADKGKPPREVFLRVVDLIIDDGGIADASGSADAPPAKDAAAPSAWRD